MNLIARLASALFGSLVSGAVEWWRAWRARADAIRLGRDETMIDALTKAAAHERRMADENLAPPRADDVDRRLRDGTF